MVGYHGNVQLWNTYHWIQDARKPLYANFRWNRRISKFQPIRSHCFVTMATDSFETPTIEFGMFKNPGIPIFIEIKEYLNFDQSEASGWLPWQRTTLKHPPLNSGCLKTPICQFSSKLKNIKISPNQRPPLSWSRDLRRKWNIRIAHPKSTTISHAKFQEDVTYGLWENFRTSSCQRNKKDKKNNNNN